MSHRSLLSSRRVAAANAPQRRFTLIELLVVVAIISVLAAMLLPALAKARSRTLRITCVSNQRQVAMTLFQYSDDNGGFVPNQNPEGGNSNGNFTNGTHQWDDAMLVTPLKRYGLIPKNMLACPAGTDSWIATSVKPGEKQSTSTFAAMDQDYFSTVCYWPGFDKIAPDPHRQWLDSAPYPAPSTQIGNDPNKIMLTDFIVWSSDSKFGYAAHGKGRQSWLSGECPTIGVLYDTTTGCNRLYADGHGEWVGRDKMGRNGGVMAPNVNTSRYSYLNSPSNSRPQFF